jgi:hypothetical protein
VAGMTCPAQALCGMMRLKQGRCRAAEGQLGSRLSSAAEQHGHVHSSRHSALDSPSCQVLVMRGRMRPWGRCQSQLPLTALTGLQQDARRSSVCEHSII